MTTAMAAEHIPRSVLSTIYLPLRQLFSINELVFDSPTLIEPDGIMS